MENIYLLIIALLTFGICGMLYKTKSFLKMVHIKCMAIIFCSGITNFATAQTETAHHHGHEAQLQRLVPSIPYLVYDNDSMSGFNKAAALANAEEEHFSVDNTKRYLFLREREYIKTKYGINPISNYRTFPPIPQSPCTNIDFESGTAAGWTTTGDAIIRSGAANDPYGGFPAVCPGGNFSLQLGNATNPTTSIARQTFAVTPANAYFVLKFAMVILNYPHSAADAARVFIRFKDGAGNVIPCPNFECYYANTSGGGGGSYGLTGFQTGSNGVNIGNQSYPTTYKPWTNLGFDLTPYNGQNITVEIENRWCVYNYDWAYCYIDGLCSTLTTSTTGGCSGSSTGTLTAPNGMEHYAWAGPVGSTVSTHTTQVVTTNVPGVYTVTCTPFSSCGTATYVYTLNFAPTATPIADFTFTTTPCQPSFSVPFNSTSSQNGGPVITGYTWTWGDATPNGTMGTQTHTYATSGTKTVKLKITNGSCTDSITKTFTISTGAAANFNLADGCLGTVSNFTSTSTPSTSIVSQVWNWGDGSPNGSGTLTNHTYTNPGAWPVKLVVTDGGLCKDSITKTINIFPKPTITFTANPACLNTPVTFVNTSTITPATSTITSWAWDFDNNGTTDNTTQSPTNNYTAAATYTVDLKATSNIGCSSTSSITVTVSALPTATFTPVNACMNANVALNNTSSVTAPASLVSYTWAFGANSNPASSSNQNPPALQYTSTGIKTITLTVMANTTCTATITETVNIFPSPTANFSTTSVCQSGSTAFTDLSTTGTGTVNAWGWDYTNDGSIDNTTQNPSFSFPASGTYTTALVVSSSSGCSNTFTAPVNVWGHALPDFSPNNVCFGTATTFTNLTNTTINANTGGTPGYTWAFADATANSTVVNPIHSYTLGTNSNAIYNVTLTATTTHGCTDYIVKPVNVYGIPTASFTSNVVCLGSSTQVTDASNGNGNSINGYQWDFLSNGTVDANNVSTANYTFPNYGTNLVSYTVSTTPALGLTCSNSISTLTVFVNPTPVPDFTFVNNCINAQPNMFDGSISTIAVGTNTNYAWAYGDNSTSTGTVTSVTHNYSIPAAYNVTLTVTSNNGCTASIVKPVSVYKKPVMSIIHNSACNGSAMSFTAVPAGTSGTVTDWYWDYNNSINTIEANGQPIVSNIFTTAGSQTIGLVSVSNPGQCRDTVKMSVYINYVPVPAFTAAHPNGCPVHCDTLLDNTPAIPLPGKIVSWNWNFGNGDSTQATSGMQQISCYDNTTSDQLKFYNVRLTVTTDSGCTNAIQKNSFVTIYPTPVANYTINPDPGSVVEPLEYFTNNSLGYTKWYWTFGDNTPFKSDSTHVSPTHFYNSETAQTYYTNLIVVNQYGCSDTAKVPIDIGPDFTFYIPNAFTPANSDGVNDLFTGSGIGIAAYDMWIFDRWGEMIFYSNDITKGWNGKKSGKSNEVQQDVYVWKVKIKDVLGKNHDYIGHVTLIR